MGANNKTEKSKPFFFFNSVEKGFLLSRPIDASVTTIGTSGQASMVLRQVKDNNKPRETCSCYVYSKKGCAAKICWRNTSGQAKQAQFTGKSERRIVQLEVQLNSIKSQMNTMVLVVAINYRIHQTCQKTNKKTNKKKEIKR